MRLTATGLAYGGVKDPYSEQGRWPTFQHLVVVANTINIGADIGAVAAASQLVVDLPFWLYALLAAILVVTLDALAGYQSYVKVLKWPALPLLSYPATAFMVAEPAGRHSSLHLRPAPWRPAEAF